MTAKEVAEALFDKLDTKSMNQDQVADVIQKAYDVEREACKKDARDVLVNWAWSIYCYEPDLFISLANDIDKKMDARRDS
jgi:hypothetical protein